MDHYRASNDGDGSSQAQLPCGVRHINLAHTISTINWTKLASKVTSLTTVCVCVWVCVCVCVCVWACECVCVCMCVCAQSIVMFSQQMLVQNVWWILRTALPIHQHQVESCCTKCHEMLILTSTTHAPTHSRGVSGVHCIWYSVVFNDPLVLNGS